MKITVVGCSGSFPGPEGPASCYLVESEGVALVVDLGNGALGSLQRHLDLYAVDAVLLSHLHPDHCMDLCSYYVARNYRPGGPPPPLPVYGPAGTAERIATAYGPDCEPGMAQTFDFRTWRAGVPVSIGPFTVTPHEVVHPVAAYGMRIVDDGGAVLAYSGDTDVCPALAELARGADLFICEASFSEGRAGPPGLHLSGGAAGAQATRAGARRLVLTHVPPWNDPQEALAAAKASFDGEVELARPGATYLL